MSTFITRLESSGQGPRVAVKDIIDVEGVPTTAGSRALQRIAEPAPADAACLAGSRAAGARLVGKANLHELAMLPIGTNPWFGTPVNPRRPSSRSVATRRCSTWQACPVPPSRCR